MHSENFLCNETLNIMYINARIFQPRHFTWSGARERCLPNRKPEVWVRWGRSWASCMPPEIEVIGCRQAVEPHQPQVLEWDIPPEDLSSLFFHLSCSYWRLAQYFMQDTLFSIHVQTYYWRETSDLWLQGPTHGIQQQWGKNAKDEARTYN